MPLDGGSGASENVVVSRAPKTAVPNSLTIEALEVGNTTWKRWLQRFQGAFLIFNIRNKDRVLYYSMGGGEGTAAFNILCDRLDPVDPFS